MPATTCRRPSAHTLPKGLSSSRSLHLNLILPQDTLYLCEPNTCQANTFLSPYPAEASKWFTVSSVHRFTVVCMSASFLRLSMDSLVRISTSAMITWSDERSCCRMQMGVPGKLNTFNLCPRKKHTRGDTPDGKIKRSSIKYRSYPLVPCRLWWCGKEIIASTLILATHELILKTCLISSLKHYVYLLKEGSQKQHQHPRHVRFKLL